MPRKGRIEAQRGNTAVVTLEAGVRDKMMNLSSISRLRRGLGTGLGQMYNGQRDVYQALGYKKELLPIDYWNKYKRQDISKRIVNAYPEATWRGDIRLIENEDETETKFEDEAETLFTDKSIIHYCTRADKLARLGRYSVMYMGLNDGGKPAEEVKASTRMELIYLAVYSELNAVVESVEGNVKSARYGKPLTYKIRVANFEGSTGIISVDGIGTSEIVVHWTRVIHVAEGLLESEVFGTPALECVYNRLENLELIAGGSAEMFWRGGFPGIAFEMDPDADMDADDVAKLDKELDEYMHSQRRYLKLQGIKANSMSSDIADPDKHVEVQLKFISGATGIPVRLLVGSERGELASSQDKENWTDRVAERRNDFAEPVILRQLIDRLIELSVLTEPAEYSVVWPDIDSLSDKDQAEIGKTRAEAIARYTISGSERIIPPLQFFIDVLGYPKDQAEAIIDAGLELFDEEEQDAREAAELLAEQQAAEQASEGATV